MVLGDVHQVAHARVVEELRVLVGVEAVERELRDEVVERPAPRVLVCHATTSGSGHVGCSTMSGLVSRKAQYQSAYSCTGANAGTVAMLACTNIP